MAATQGMSAQTQPHWNSSNLLSTVYYQEQELSVCVFDIYFFNLSTPLGRPEYVKIQLSKIPQEFISEYNLNSLVQKGWTYFEIRCGCYGLPQSGILENKQLRMKL